MAIFKPLTDLKDTTGICEFCLQNHEPIFVTRNGTPELVIMNADFSNEHFRFRDTNGKLDFAKEFSVSMTIPIRDLKKLVMYLNFVWKTINLLASLRTARSLWS